MLYTFNNPRLQIINSISDVSRKYQEFKLISCFVSIFVLRNVIGYNDSLLPHKLKFNLIKMKT